MDPMPSTRSARTRRRRRSAGLLATLGTTVALFAAAAPAYADGASATAQRSSADSAPAVPTSVGTTPPPQDSPGHPNYGCNGTGDWGWIANGGSGGKVTLVGKISDPDPGQLVTAQFELWDGAHHLIVMGRPADPAAGTLSSSSDSGWQTSGSIASKSVPTSYLVDGHSYGFRLRADDGTLRSAASTSCHFRYDATAPTLSINGASSTGSCIDGGSLPAGRTSLDLDLRGEDSGSGLDHFDTDSGVGPLAPDADGAATLHLPLRSGGDHTVTVTAVDRAGNDSSLCYQFFAAGDPTPQVVPGDIDGDGLPDFTAVPVAGSYASDPGLRYYPTNVSSPRGAIASHSTDGPNPDGSWTGALTAHRSSPTRSVTGARVDDLLALGTGHALYLYRNNGSTAGSHDNQLYSGDSRAFLPRPGCDATLADCSRYPADWSSVRQLVAPGDMNGDGTPDLVTEETGGLLWFFPGNTIGQLGSPQLIGTGTWDGYTLIAPGNTPTTPGTAALWARDNATGALFRYDTSVDASTGTLSLSSGARIGGGYPAAVYPLIISVGDINGDGLPDLIATTSTGSLVDQLGSTTAAFDGTPGRPTRIAAGGWNQISTIS
jgi:hypothetical protein